MTDPLDELGPDRPRYHDFPDFEPDLSPGRMLAAGVFDGGYFSAWDDDQLEGIDQSILDAGPHQETPNAREHNRFGVHSGLNWDEWKKRGWLREDLDPVGWFQWYCRFHSGRRSDDDERQIKRWIDFRNRWQPKSLEALERMKPGPKTRQALLSWAIDPWLPEHALGVTVTSDDATTIAEEEGAMDTRDDLDGDPVIVAALARDGTTVADLAWRSKSRWEGSGHPVEEAHHAGICVVDATLHRDEGKVWFATAHFGKLVSYHAQRGRRSITLRRDMPDTLSSGLVGRTADAVADAPGFDRLVVTEVRLSPGAPSTIIVEPERAEGSKA